MRADLDGWGKGKAHKHFVEQMISSSKHSYKAHMKIMWNECLNSWNEQEKTLHGPHKMGNEWLSFWNNEGNWTS